jgi:SpoVK/Ycf46/Vps4 family AAA+-type ATPase
VRYGREVAEPLTPEELAGALRDLMAWAAAHAPVEESPLRARLRDHLGCDPAELPVASTALLFELLNEMDGMQQDLDVVFLLTTNRPDRLEPALASRPGRVDMAVELPLPDAGGRRRLISLYSQGLELRATNLADVVERSAGASPAFIRELLRRAALLAVDSADGDLVVGESELGGALEELTSGAGPLTGTLLGMQPSE